MLERIAEVPEPDKVIAERIHEIVRTTAPHLAPRTWYGMPAYTDAAGRIVCFYKGAYKFKARYGVLGFEDAAQIDDGVLWPTVFAIAKMTASTEKEITRLVAKAAG